jgi:hypothetical protein
MLFRTDMPCTDGPSRSAADDEREPDVMTTVFWYTSALATTPMTEIPP